MTTVETISFISSIFSLILAVVAIIYSYISSKESNENFRKTQEYMSSMSEKINETLNKSHEKTKDVLSEIDKKSAIIEATVSESQRTLMSTMTNILNETIIPKRPDMGEQLGMHFMQTFLANPEEGAKAFEKLMPLIEMQERMNKKN